MLLRSSSRLLLGWRPFFGFVRRVLDGVVGLLGRLAVVIVVAAWNACLGLLRSVSASGAWFS